MRNIAIFASGSGTNAENIIKYFSNRKSAKVSLVLTNKREATVIKRAEALGVRTVFFDRDQFYYTGAVTDMLREANTDFIVLAGFLWLVPKQITEIFEKRIVNIHPALLPAYGGRGMYGQVVHKAVIDNREKKSGITIHYVNNHYDEGDIIFQASCEVKADDTPETLASRIHELEYRYFPEVIEDLVLKLKPLSV